jgi:hypothetical protein
MAAQANVRFPVYRLRRFRSAAVGSKLHCFQCQSRRRRLNLVRRCERPRADCRPPLIAAQPRTSPRCACRCEVPLRWRRVSRPWRGRAICRGRSIVILGLPILMPLALARAIPADGRAVRLGCDAVEQRKTFNGSRHVRRRAPPRFRGSTSSQSGPDCGLALRFNLISGRALMAAIDRRVFDPLAQANIMPKGVANTQAKIAGVGIHKAR